MTKDQNRSLQRRFPSQLPKMALKKPNLTQQTKHAAVKLKNTVIQI